MKNLALIFALLTGISTANAGQTLTEKLNALEVKGTRGKAKCALRLSVAALRAAGVNDTFYLNAYSPGEMFVDQYDLSGYIVSPETGIKVQITGDITVDFRKDAYENPAPKKGCFIFRKRGIPAIEITIVKNGRPLVQVPDGTPTIRMDAFQ
jgi:hypothetical protein